VYTVQIEIFVANILTWLCCLHQ